MRYFYYGKEKEEKRNPSGEKNSAIGLSSASIETKTYDWEEDLVIEEDTIYEIDRMCLSRRSRRRPGA